MGGTRSCISVADPGLPTLDAAAFIPHRTAAMIYSYKTRSLCHLQVGALGQVTSLWDPPFGHR